MQNFNIVNYIISDLNLSKILISNTINLLNEGSTIPFIARYRKEKTGNLDEKEIKHIFLKYEYYNELEKRKETILKTIKEQGKLTEELKNKIINCKEKQIPEDIYLPYKPKKRTRAIIAREKGLGPLADIMLGKVKTEGSFNLRKEFLKVPKLGNKIFEQCAGFLRISNKENPLDNSGIHPESYHIVKKMAADIKTDLKELIGNQKLINQIKIKKYVNNQVGQLTLTDIINELKKPGQDPCKKFSSFSFDDKINEVSDLKEGMLLDAVITNVTNFGAFADIGVHQDGLIHISKLSDSFVKDPRKIVAVGNLVKVKVLTIDEELKRISLEKVG